MSIQSTIVDIGSHQDRAYLAEVADILRTQQPLIIRLIMGIFICITISISAALVVARMQPAPRIIEQPQDLLPGHLLPSRIQCVTPPNSSCYLASYSINTNGKAVHFIPDPEFRTIAYVLVEANEYTMGDLLAAWGTPTGFTQCVGEVTVFWGTHKAFFFTQSFQPDSHVELIVYALEPYQAPRWHGFISAQGYKC